MKKKIVLLPLDKRPCNYDFPYELFAHDDLEIVRPKEAGNKKVPADVEKIREFLLKECEKADGLILSVDMLLYGGLVPSRIHHGTLEEFMKLAETIKEVKKKNPGLLIYAFQVIMRCPRYSNSDEEPDYYEEYGELIHKAGELVHRSRLGIEDEISMQEIYAQINKDCLNDYVGRRQINREMNYHILKYVEEGYIDYLVIPQDDSAPYGYAAIDQEDVRREMFDRNLTDKVLMYPGADEVGLTLITRMINRNHQRQPKVYIKYASEGSQNLIPLYEGMRLSGTLKYHILSAGCQMTACYENADFILIVTAPSEKMEEASSQPSKMAGYNIERNLPEIVDFIKGRLKENKIITIADNAYANGGDLELIRMLDNNHLLTEVAGYAGWNTSANTIGTAIAEGIDALYYGRTKEHQNFLVQRYIEDTGYCSVVRGIVTQKVKNTDRNYFDVKEETGIVSEMVEKELQHFIARYLGSVCDQVWINSVYMPWRRLFEVGFHAGIEEQE